MGLSDPKKKFGKKNKFCFLKSFNSGKLGPNFFDPKLTWPDFFQTERNWRLACHPSFCELVLICDYITWTGFFVGSLCFVWKVMTKQICICAYHLGDAEESKAP